MSRVWKCMLRTMQVLDSLAVEVKTEEDRNMMLDLRSIVVVVAAAAAVGIGLMGRSWSRISVRHCITRDKILTSLAQIREFLP